MSILRIHVLGSPVLRQVTKEIETVTDEHRRLIDDMFETMYAAHGIGLAAPQVGRTERIAVVDVDDAPFAIVNPVIVDEDKTLAKGEEGCLSIPDVYGDVSRPETVKVRALDRDGNPFEIDAEGLLARCLQHEIDHLDGRMFIDHLSVLRRKAALAKWATIKGKYPGYIRTLTADEIAEHHHRDEEL
ncbi:MAG TPA: peptide deformylase [Gemmatimonadaceae bacterium]|nr:peptide deformylase [Gemmatimonadaceae bacterium]